MLMRSGKAWTANQCWPRHWPVPMPPVSALPLLMRSQYLDSPPLSTPRPFVHLIRELIGPPSPHQQPRCRAANEFQQVSTKLGRNQLECNLLGPQTCLHCQLISQPTGCPFLRPQLMTSLFVQHPPSSYSTPPLNMDRSLLYVVAHQLAKRRGR